MHMPVEKYSTQWEGAGNDEIIHVKGEEYFAVNIITGAERPIPEPKEAFRPHAETRGNEVVWMKDPDTAVQVTSYRNGNIVCGQAVSRHEFGTDRGIFHSPDGTMAAFYINDQSRVSSFPLLDITTRTGTLQSIKYPMAGMDSERLRIGVYDSATGRTAVLEVTDFSEERYLTNPTWSPDGRTLYIQILDRAQKHMHLNAYDASTGKCLGTLFEESDPRYVEPYAPLRFLRSDPDTFIYSSNSRDGYRSLYLYSLKKKELSRLTDVDADTEYVGQDDRGNIYYYSREISPAQRHLFRISVRNGRKERMTSSEGFHTCSLSPDGRYWTDDYSSLHVPHVVEVSSTDGKKGRVLLEAEDPTEGRKFTAIRFGSLKSADGKFDNFYRLILPAGFDPGKKYPVILYVYGGPHSQMVTDSFLANIRIWEMYMAQRGYAVFVMDNRGTMGHGSEYEKAIHRRCGRCEMEDQMKGMEWLMSHPWVDRERIGIHGWSYGGFMTISLMVNHPEIFRVGVAGGPVIDWKYYEIMYGERYMETPQSNPEGFAETSLMSRAKDLKGRLLICQGAVDDTVVWQNSLSFIQNCIDLNIPVDYFPYPKARHNVRGDNRIHLMQKVTDYFDTFLK